MAFLKPQSPLSQGNDYFYPLTTADQVIMKGGYRLDQIVGAVEKSTITLYANGWSVEVPYSYSVTVEGLDDNVNMKMLPHFPEDFESKQAMKEETAKISFASRSGNILTFECWDEVPTIDIPVDIEIDITYPGVPNIKMNYSVVGGTEEPANPTENMIWVNTDQEITDWVFSKNEPKNPKEKMIWFTIGDNNNVSFFTLRIDGREFDEVYPLTAKQYVNGAWVSVEAKSYQNGEWVEWFMCLYNSGNECTDITGGFYYEARRLQSNQNASGSATLTKNQSNMILTQTSTSGAYGSAICATTNKIDLTDIKNIILDYSSYSGANGFLCTWSSIGTYTMDNITSQIAFPEPSGKISLDTTTLSGMHIVGVYIGESYSKTATLTIHNIYCEKE